MVSMQGGGGAEKPLWSNVYNFGQMQSTVVNGIHAGWRGCRNTVVVKCAQIWSNVDNCSQWYTQGGRGSEIQLWSNVDKFGQMWTTVVNGIHASRGP
jgi:hypothetical protein